LGWEYPASCAALAALPCRQYWSMNVFCLSVLITLVNSLLILGKCFEILQFDVQDFPVF
jgi:hypothetical protein